MRRLFVVGSLRKGESNHDKFTGFGDRLIAIGTVSGVVLKDLGSYPALFPTGNAADRVVGEIYDIGDELGAIVDRWESGDGYVPRPVKVNTPHGTIEAEAYFYGQPESIASRPMVEGGDWSRRSLALEQGGAAYEKGAWTDAFRQLSAADTARPLAPHDLHRLATAAYLVGDDSVSAHAWTRAHAANLEAGATLAAARNAFWLGFSMLDRPSQRSQAGGWLAKAQRLVDEAGAACVEQGWLLCGTARQRANTGDFTAALEAFTRATAIATRFGDRDLIALSRHGQGRVLLMLNRVEEGLVLFDEVMVSIATGEIGPIVTGVVYCSVISACHDRCDLQRAQEWTVALQDWCDAHPDVVPFRGYCLVRRSELMQLHGAWDEALSEARRVCERPAGGLLPPEAGAAFYRQAEIHRLRGEFTSADESYRLASQAGARVQPGLALLRLAQGQRDSADAAIRLALKEVRDMRSRVLVLAAAVDIMLATGDAAAARAAADDLARLAGELALPFPNAISSQASGVVALAEDEALSALEWLRAARSKWQELDAPYESAQVRVLIGQAYQRLGDREGAQLEFDAAQEAFERLGAQPAAARIAQLSGAPPITTTSGLTGREIEVLRLIATGVTNRTIAERLDISEKTVARHISNIFTKLDLPSRAAATAYAYEHKLI